MKRACGRNPIAALSSPKLHAALDRHQDPYEPDTATQCSPESHILCMRPPPLRRFDQTGLVRSVLAVVRVRVFVYVYSVPCGPQCGSASAFLPPEVARLSLLPNILYVYLDKYSHCTRTSSQPHGKSPATPHRNTVLRVVQKSLHHPCLSRTYLPTVLERSRYRVNNT